jgi:hypothetical protein
VADIYGAKALGTPTKQEALLFDKIATVHPRLDPKTASLHEYLEENGVLARLAVNPSTHPNFDLIERLMVRQTALGTSYHAPFFPDMPHDYKESSKIMFDIIRADKGFCNVSTDSLDQYVEDTFPRILSMWTVYTARRLDKEENIGPSSWQLVDLMTRYLSSQVCLFNDVTSILHSGVSFGQRQQVMRSENLLQVVINKLPVPSEITPWEAIIDFRNDPKVKAQFVELRRWIRKSIHGELPINELEDELTSLINQYRRYMDLHKMKFRLSTIKALSTAPLAFLEDLLKLRWKNLGDAVFSVAEGTIALTEAELKAPGRELSYLVAARERFDKI